MEITVETTSQAFTTRVAGVSFSNADGVNRQDLLKRCRVGQPVRLVREHGNPHDKTNTAIAVCLLSGDQIGYIPSGDIRLAQHIDQGGRVDASILKITGGSGGLLSFLLPSRVKSYGCVLRIEKGDPDWSLVRPWLEANRAASNLTHEAEDHEGSAPERAVQLYNEAIALIRFIDSQGRQAAAWRSVRHPLNRLSMTLERMGKAEESLGAIEGYEQSGDVFGLTATDRKAVEARRRRLQKKLRGR